MPLPIFIFICFTICVLSLSPHIYRLLTEEVDDVQRWGTPEKWQGSVIFLFWGFFFYPILGISMVSWEMWAE